MPRATVTTETQHHDLKTCEGAFVVLKPMTYGTKLSRQGEAMRMVVKNEAGPRKRGQSQNSETEIHMLQKAATQIDFQNCIVDHNLEDEQGKKLDFRNFADIDSLDPRIGEEISTLIDEMNNFSEDEAGN
jgi:hypothetical protein